MDSSLKIIDLGNYYETYANAFWCTSIYNRTCKCLNALKNNIYGTIFYNFATGIKDADRAADKVHPDQTLLAGLLCLFCWLILNKILVRHVTWSIAHLNQNQ